MNKQSLACPAPSRIPRLWDGSAELHSARPLWAHLLTIFALAIAVVLVVLVLAALPLGASTTKSAVQLFANSDVGPELLVYSLSYQVEFVNDPQIVVPLQRFVDRIAVTMGLPTPIRLSVIHHSQPEALSAPPHSFLITTGMLASVSSDDQLAGIVARELAHVQLHHAIRAVTRMRMIRSPEAEYAADRAAVSFLALAGYDPQQFSEFLKKLASENAAAAYLADRPDVSLRLLGLESQAAVARGTGIAATLSSPVAALVDSVRTLYPPHRRPRNRPMVASIPSVFGP